MAPPEANIEMVVMARKLPTECIDLSIPCGSARDETGIAILLAKRQRAKITEVHRQGPGYYTQLKTDKLAADARNAASSEADGSIPFPNTMMEPRRRRCVVHGFKYSSFVCTG